jgi:fluoroquinolone transport system permease protein
MNKRMLILKADLTYARRDPTLLVMMFLSIIMLLVLRFLVPELVNFIPAISNYYHVISGFFGLISAAFSGFVVSFIILDEKDQNILTALRVTPLSPSDYLLSRIQFMIIFGFMSSFLIFSFNGISHFSFFQSIILSALSALSSPSIVLIIAVFAKNKIEGVTMMKVLNIVLLLPIFQLFINHPVEYLLGIMPSFWVYKTVELITLSKEIHFIAFMGFLVISILNYLLYIFCLKKLF